MKKSKLLLTALLGASLFGLASCNNAVSEESKESISSNESVSESTSDGEYTDSITESLKFTRNIEGKTFLTNGVEEATVTRLTDGDTSTFRTKSGTSVTVRYLAVDTPESTAGYDKWGKAASKWNASILSKATSIILESNGSKPEKDTNGTRYLAFVWYKLAGDTEYKNLNLQTVEEAYSRNTGTSSTNKYNSYFTEAAKKAQKANLRLYNKHAVDIYFPETITNVSIKDLLENSSNYYDSSTDVPTRVAFEAYITDVEVSSSGFTTATVSQNINGTIYSYGIVAGYSGSGEARLFSADTMNAGSLIYICGFTNGENQLHGVLAGDAFLNTGKEYANIKQSFYYLDMSNATISAAYIASDIRYVEVTIDSKTYKVELKNSTKTEAEMAGLVGKKFSAPTYSQDDSSTTNIEMYAYDSQVQTK